MGQTMAEVLIQEGRELGYKEGMIRTKQEDLINLLHAKFGQFPPNVVEQIRKIEEIGELDSLLNRFVTAARLEDMKFE